jgi:hypothetical protein
MRGHVEIVKLLLQRSGDASLRNAQGLEPADLCMPQWSHAWRYTRQALAAPLGF